MTAVGESPVSVVARPTVGVETGGIRWWARLRSRPRWHNVIAHGILIAAIWKQFGYNLAFYLAGLQAIPGSVLEAASVDGAGPVRRFFAISFPLLSPVTFFLFTLNMTFSFFDTFGIIHAVTQGGPGDATSLLVYKAWKDGFEGLQLGLSAAQSVLLMALVIVLTALQFRYAERKVTY